MKNEASTKEEVKKESKKIKIDDELLINSRKNLLKVTKRYDYYTDVKAVSHYFELEGNGSRYLLVIFKDNNPRIYTESNYKIENVEFTSGYKAITETNKGRRVRTLFVNYGHYCMKHSIYKMYNSKEESYYCPRCMQ
jgi:hypothetical protein